MSTALKTRVYCSECLHLYGEHLDLVGCLHTVEIGGEILSCICVGFTVLGD